MAGSFAFAEPILTTFGQDPNVFSRYGSQGWSIVAWALAVLLLPAIVGWLAEIIIGALRPSARRWLHLALLTVAVALWAMRLARMELGWYGGVAILVAGVAAGGFAFAYRRVRGVRVAMLALCWVPLVVLSSFLATPGVWDLVQSDGTLLVPDTLDPATQDATEVAPLGTVESQTPVVFLVLDAFPTWALLDGHGQIDENLYPNLAALAGTATWYRNSTTVAPNTTRALPAMLSGKVGDPSDHSTFTASSHPETLFTLLGGDYEMNVFEPIGTICPINLCPDTLGDRRDLIAETWTQWTRSVWPNLVNTADYGILPTGRVDRFHDWLGDLSGGSTLNFQHALIPHDPWTVNEDLQTYDGPKDPAGTYFYVWGLAESALLGRQRFLLQAQAADQMVGELVDRMKDLGIWDEALLVVAADHGTSFVEGNSQRGLDEDTVAEVVWQLNMMKLPGQTTGEMSDARVRTIDILPTIADVLDIEVPWPIDGVSMLGAIPERSTLPVMTDWVANRGDLPDDFLDVDPGLFDEVLAHRAATEGVTQDELVLYRMGPYGDLVGEKVTDLDVSERSVAGALDDSSRWSDVDTDAHELPLYFNGSFGESDARNVAVSLNGTIAFTGPTHNQEIWGVMAGRYLVDGHNEVDAYLVEGPPSAPTLTPIG